MIASSQKSDWQSAFKLLLPGIERYARHAFRRLPREAREEAVQETIANCLVAFVRLWNQGRSHVAYPTVLARYAAKQIREGRSVAHPINSGDVMSRCARRRHGIDVSRLFHKDKDDEWQELAVEDKRSSPADVAALRIDFSEWLGKLSSRVRRIAALLASGETTSAVAKLVGLTCGRISQLRRELERSWRMFQGELAAA